MGFEGLTVTNGVGDKTVDADRVESELFEGLECFCSTAQRKGKKKVGGKGD
jgi:hypothetical protein